MIASSEAKSILIVDDDAEFAGSLEKILRKDGYEASYLGDGVEALRVLSSCRFDLVITDFRMGPISGLEFIRRMRSQRITSPILLLTAFGDEELEKAAHSAGANDYLCKPLRREVILRSVARLLAREKNPLDNTSKNSSPS